MTVTGTETAECDKWAEIVALAQQGNKKMLGVILQAFDIKLRKIAHTSAYKGFAEDGEQIERIAVVKALEKWGQRQDFEKLPAFIVSKSYTALSSEWKRRHKDEEMTCPYEIESGCEFAEEVLTADAAQTTRTYFEQQQLLVQLSPKQEELIELHFLEGWSNGELARRFGVSPAAISKTIKKGLTKLRQLLLAAHQAEKQREAEELMM
jgi:RNA polymerase sigma factor, sigma-70 family